jgi:chromosome segregation protein
MYLKRLEIQGFKSFANHTALDFLSPKNGRHSVTGVVGPNGSGKSNITDAVRWVMGETSLKNLRGKKSEDVIFSGSERKGALGAAEVTMVLDNKDANGVMQDLQLGVEFPLLDTSEIAITRRLYRDGESEYLINHTQARLLDVHILLAKLQFAEHSYSIVSQGMIDKLLTVGPNERKDFFDEACGIKEFQIKEHQAALKLARTKDNMTQAQTLLPEVEPRLKLLSRQVKKLEKRHEVEQELRSTQEAYYGTLAHQHSQEHNQLKTQLADIEARYRTSFDALSNTQEELAALARGQSSQGAYEVLQANYQGAQSAKLELERKLAIIQGQLGSEYRASGAHNVSWLQQKQAEVNAATERQQRELAVVTSEAEDASRRLSLERERVEKSQRELTETKLKVSRLQSELLKSQSEQSYREYSGLAAVKAVLDSRDDFGKVYGVVTQLAEASEAHALALEVAAGTHVSSLVVDNEETARRAIEFLRSRRFGVATFLPLTKIEPNRYGAELDAFVGLPGVIGKAVDLVSFDKKFENIFSFVFGSTLIVENLKVAERIGIGRCRMVTLEGDVVERKGVMRGGFRTRRPGMGFTGNSNLTSGEHLEEVSAQIQLESSRSRELEQQLEKAKEALVGATVAEASARERVTLRTSEFTSTQAESQRVNHELELVTASPEQYSEQLKKLKHEAGDLEKQLKEQEKQVAHAQNELETFNEREQEKQNRVFALQEKMQREQLSVNNIMGERSTINVELAKVDTKREDLAREVQAELHSSLESVMSRTQNAHEQNLEELQSAIEKLKYNLSLIGGIDEEVVSEHATTKERFDFLTTQLTDLTKATEDLEEMIAELSELMKKKRAAAFKNIRKEFDRYFKILFEGGNAGLEEVYGYPQVEEQPLVEGEGAIVVPELEPEQVETPKKRDKILMGIEVTANPPGKKIKNLSSLSGGERTLTSIALICAILHTNPSPFVILDEVEAALDEANTQRFTRILTELTTVSQFIIVTHNRVTMHSSDALYGVVMQGDGISKLLSVKIEDAVANAGQG